MVERRDTTGCGPQRGFRTPEACQRNNTQRAWQVRSASSASRRRRHPAEMHGLVIGMPGGRRRVLATLRRVRTAPMPMRQRPGMLRVPSASPASLVVNRCGCRHRRLRPAAPARLERRYNVSPCSHGRLEARELNMKTDDESSDRQTDTAESAIFLVRSSFAFVLGLIFLFTG